MGCPATFFDIPHHAQAAPLRPSPVAGQQRVHNSTRQWRILKTTFILLPASSLSSHCWFISSLGEKPGGRPRSVQTFNNLCLACKSQAGVWGVATVGGRTRNPSPPLVWPATVSQLLHRTSESRDPCCQHGLVPNTNIRFAHRLSSDPWSSCPPPYQEMLKEREARYLSEQTALAVKEGFGDLQRRPRITQCAYHHQPTSHQVRCPCCRWSVLWGSPVVWLQRSGLAVLVLIGIRTGRFHDTAGNHAVWSR